MLILNTLLKASPSTVKEATDFNLANIGLIEGEGVAYGFSCQNNGDGSSRVKLLISLLYESKTYEWDTDIDVTNGFENQLSLILTEDSAEIDKIGIIVPEEGINKQGEKYVKGLTFITYGIKQLSNTPLVEYLDKAKLQKNINNRNLANIDNSYFQPKAVKVGDGDVIVIAHNLKDQSLVSWYLRPDKSGKLKALAGRNGVTEIKLFKFDNPGQLALDRNMMFYSQMREKITKENQKVKKTHIFTFDVAKVAEDLKSGKGANGDFLLGTGTGKINKASSLSSEHEISFLQYVKRINGDNLVAFLENDQSANKQRVRIATIFKDGSKSNFTAYEFEGPIEQLYVKNDGQDSFIVTAVSGKNIITFNHKNLEESHKVTIIPADSITLSDFVNIINGRLTPSIVSSSTLAPVTTETVVTSGEASTVPAITSTAETTKLTTEAPSPTTISTSATSSTTQPLPDSTTQTSTERSTTVQPITTTVTSQATTGTTTPTKASTVTSDATKISTGKPTIADETTTASQATTITTDADETSTTKPTSATVAPTSTMRKLSTKSTTQPSTVKPTTINTPVTSKATVATTPSTDAPTVTSNAKTSTEEPSTATVLPTSTADETTTEQAKTSTNAPTTDSKRTTQVVFTMPSVGTKKSTTSVFTKTLPPQFTSPTPPTRRAIAGNPNEAGIIAGSLLGAVVFIGIIIGYIVYKLKEYRQRNAVPVLALTDLHHGRQSSSSNSSSNDEINTALENASVRSSRSSSPSPESSRRLESNSRSNLSRYRNGVSEYHL